MKNKKTNVMRFLEKENIAYTPHFYTTTDGLLDGISVANKTNQDVNQVFKTLVTHCENSIFVFCIPVCKELNLKAAAKAAKQKYIEMIPAANITKITGYIKGGCSPFCMKKFYPTFLDESAFLFHTIFVSGGHIGTQVEIAAVDLVTCLQAVPALLTL